MVPIYLPTYLDVLQVIYIYWQLFHKTCWELFIWHPNIMVAESTQKQQRQAHFPALEPFA